MGKTRERPKGFMEKLRSYFRRSKNEVNDKNDDYHNPFIKHNLLNEIKSSE